MPIIDLEQGSKEWLEWRRGLITASNASVLLGKNQYKKTPKMLWEEMMGIAEPTKVNYAMQRGTMMEPLLRDIFINVTGIWIDPVCVQHAEYPFLGASLDGFNQHEGIIVELKTGSMDLYEAVKNGKNLREDYFIQIQHQDLCCQEFDVKKIYLGVQHPHDQNQMAIRCYDKDEKLQELIVEVSKKFYYDHVVTKMPPKVGESERIVRTGDRLKYIASRLDVISDMEAALKKERDSLKAEAQELCDNSSADFYGWSLIFTNSSTGIDYKKACEENGIDLEKYHRPKKERFILRPRK